MEKITEKLNKAFKDVRLAYRLLFDFQKNLIDLVKYIGAYYGFQSPKWYNKFTQYTANNGRRLDVKNWAWDWLPMYFSEFLFEADRFFFRVISIADSGWFDNFLPELKDSNELDNWWVNEVNHDKKLCTDEFNDADKSKTLIVLLVEKRSKNENKPDNELSKKYGNLWHTYHYKEFFPKETPRKQGGEGYYLEVHDLSEFYSIEETDRILKEFAKEVRRRGLADLKFYEIK